MAKRGADKYLTDQNWDHEEEDEEEVSDTFNSCFVAGVLLVLELNELAKTSTLCEWTCYLGYV